MTLKFGEIAVIKMHKTGGAGTAELPKTIVAEIYQGAAGVEVMEHPPSADEGGAVYPDMDAAEGEWEVERIADCGSSCARCAEIPALNRAAYRAALRRRARLTGLTPKKLLTNDMIDALRA